ncbi:uncharacterized protein [Haliotis asinina]|uniref:uncharacterized protein n=1 Tax=Haliotis asinina TaxID=109174 RepID=UPI003531D22C
MGSISIVIFVPEQDANNQSEMVTCCIGDDAKFPWTGDVPPFIVIEWYFNNTLIAQTYRGSLSQDTLIIEKDYEDRFHLTRTGDAGFYITNARENDTGEYKCVVTMQDTGEERAQQKPLKVIDCATSTRSSTSGDDTTTPRSTPAHIVSDVAIAMGVLIPCAVIVLVFGVWIYRKRKGRLSTNTRHPFPSRFLCSRLPAKKESNGTDIVVDLIFQQAYNLIEELTGPKVKNSPLHPILRDMFTLLPLLSLLSLVSSVSSLLLWSSREKAFQRLEYSMEC